MGIFKSAEEPVKTYRRITSVYLPSSKLVYRLGHNVVGSNDTIDKFELDSFNPTSIKGYNALNEIVMRIVTSETIILTYDDSDKEPIFDNSNN